MGDERLRDHAFAAMKTGMRALGVAESFRQERSTLCGAVVTGEGVVDGFAFASCTVAGLDATDGVVELWSMAGREDVRYLFISGVALAWYNIVDLRRLGEAIPVPILAITYEESDGLEPSIREHFSGAEAAERLDRYASLPERIPVELDDETLYIRTNDTAEEELDAIVRTFTRVGGRPEPIRVARLAARAADRWFRESAAE